MLSRKWSVLNFRQLSGPDSATEAWIIRSSASRSLLPPHDASDSSMRSIPAADATRGSAASAVLDLRLLGRGSVASVRRCEPLLDLDDPLRERFDRVVDRVGQVD